MLQPLLSAVQYTQMYTNVCIVRFIAVLLFISNTLSVFNTDLYNRSAHRAWRPKGRRDLNNDLRGCMSVFLVLEFLPES